MSGALIEWAGLAGVEAECSDAVVHILAEHAYRYRIAGGVWTPDAWSALSTDERAACIAAGLRYERERTRGVLAVTEQDAREASLASALEEAIHAAAGT